MNKLSSDADIRSIVVVTAPTWVLFLTPFELMHRQVMLFVVRTWWNVRHQHRYPRRLQSPGGRVFIDVCLSISTISQKPMKLGSPNFKLFRGEFWKPIYFEVKKSKVKDELAGVGFALLWVPVSSSYIFCSGRIHVHRNSLCNGLLCYGEL